MLTDLGLTGCSRAAITWGISGSGSQMATGWGHLKDFFTHCLAPGPEAGTAGLLGHLFSCFPCSSLSSSCSSSSSRHVFPSSLYRYLDLAGTRRAQKIHRSYVALANPASKGIQGRFIHRGGRKGPPRSRGGGHRLHLLMEGTLKNLRP